MNQIALPVASSPARSRWTLWVVLPGIAIIALAGIWAVMGARTAGPVVAQSMLYTVAPMDFPIKINKDGELQATNNIEIMSQVEGQTTIQTLIPEGSTVKKGDLLMHLDDSAIKQRIEDTTLELQKAEADLTTAKELKDIQENQNTADLEAAQVALDLAQLDLKQYVEGTYPQQLANAKTDLDMAEINLKNQEEKLGQTRALFEKGFVTQTAVKDDELSVTTAQNTVSKAQTALKVLTEYTHQMDMASKGNAVSQARQRLERTKRINASQLAQRIADVNAKTQTLQVMERRMQRYQEQFAACTINAPADGLVVYATSGDRNAQQNIQEGTTVRERQMLFRLPDTSEMKAVVRVQEGQVAKLREGMRARVKIVGVPQPLGATLTRISVLADSGQRFFNPDLKEYPVDLVLDQTPSGLKPGMGAMTEIYVDQVTNAMAVPLTSIYSAGADSYVFVQQGERVEPRKVRVGRTNETHAELLGDAVKSGDQVLMLQVGQGQQLLEKAGIKAAPTTQNVDSAPGGDGRRGNRGGGGGGGGGGRRGGGGGNGGGRGAGSGANPALSAPPPAQAP
jgi:HlyD family secretion protein